MTEQPLDERDKVYVYTYDDSGGFRGTDDYLFRAEAQPEALMAGQFIVGYSDQSIYEAQERCKEACLELGLVDDPSRFRVEGEEEFDFGEDD